MKTDELLILGLNEHQVLNYTCLVDDSPYAADDKIPNVIGNCECTPFSVHLPALPLTVFLPLAVYHPLSTIQCLPPTINFLPSTSCRLPSTVYQPPSTIHCLPSTDFHPLPTIYQIQLKTCNNNLFTMR